MYTHTYTHAWNVIVSHKVVLMKYKRQMKTTYQKKT